MTSHGIYQHYKGNQYEVIAVGKIEATEEPCVVYKAQYGIGQVWIRPLMNFEETVEVNGESVPRFRRVS